MIRKSIPTKHPTPQSDQRPHGSAAASANSPPRPSPQSRPGEPTGPTFADRLKGFAEATRERLESLPRTEQSLRTPQEHGLPAKTWEKSTTSVSPSKAGPDLAELKPSAQAQAQDPTAAQRKQTPSKKASGSSRSSEMETAAIANHSAPVPGQKSKPRRSNAHATESQIEKLSAALADSQGSHAGLKQNLAQSAPAVAAAIAKAASTAGDDPDPLNFNSGDLEVVAHQARQTMAKAQKTIDRNQLEGDLPPTPEALGVEVAAGLGLSADAGDDAHSLSPLPEPIGSSSELADATSETSHPGSVSFQPLGMSLFERLALSTIIACEHHLIAVTEKEMGGKGDEPPTKPVSTVAGTDEIEAGATPAVVEPTAGAVAHLSNGAPTSDISPGLDEMVISSTHQTDFDLNDSEMTFSGDVQVKSPRFNLRADKFIVHLKSDNSGMSHGEAIGDVVIELREAGQPTGYTGLADNAIYDPGEGKITLSGWPKIRQQFKEHVAITRDTKMVLYTDGRVKTLGRNRTLIRK